MVDFLFKFLTLTRNMLPGNIERTIDNKLANYNNWLTVFDFFLAETKAFF
jgi:hypothetical protein